MDDWTSEDTDSGVRLSTWLGAAPDRDITVTRVDDSVLGVEWLVTLRDCYVVVGRGRDRLIDEAWCKALREVARKAA